LGGGGLNTLGRGGRGVRGQPAHVRGLRNTPGKEKKALAFFRKTPPFEKEGTHIKGNPYLFPAKKLNGKE